MKKLHFFIVKSFLGPFIFTFLIALFILLMQFLWKYIDDLVGKGLESIDIFKLLFYASARLVPLALPISILLSSIMTFGNLAENNELSAIKSAGFSFTKSMSNLLILIIGISVLSYLFSNYYLPYANLKAGTLLYDIRKQKPALNIKAGSFYNGLENYSIKIDKKSDNGKDLENIMIYDHTSGNGNNKVIISEKGSMYLSENEKYFIISLENGNSYIEEIDKKNSFTKKHQRINFKKNILRFDLSSFGLKRSNQELYKNHYAMMSNNQLIISIDSINNEIIKQFNATSNKINKRLFEINIDSLEVNKAKITETKNYKKRKEIYKKSIDLAKTNKSLIEANNRDFKYREYLLCKHKVEWHRKFTLSFACLVMFLIGAPLGSIIKKGGFGMPVIISVFFFIIYHVVSMTGEKMVKNGELSTFEGMWAANIFLFPISILLVYKASKDSNIFDFSYLKINLKKLFN